MAAARRSRRTARRRSRTSTPCAIGRAASSRSTSKAPSSARGVQGQVLGAPREPCYSAVMSEHIGIIGYDSFHFVVENLDRSRRFYTERFDFKEVARAGDEL